MKTIFFILALSILPGQLFAQTQKHIETLKKSANDLQMDKALQVLKKTGSQKFAFYLKTLLKDKDPNIQLFAVTMLGSMGDNAKTSIPEIAALLDGKNLELQIAAFWGLLQMGQEGKKALKEAVAVETLAILLKSKSLHLKIVASELLSQKGQEGKMVLVQNKGEQSKIRIALNEKTAKAALRYVALAQEKFKQRSLVDQDKDGIGEYGLFNELASNGKFISFSFTTSGKIDGMGYSKKSGYNFCIYLPGGVTDGNSPLRYAKGTIKIESKERQKIIDQQEGNFFICAWPAKSGKTGKKAFFINKNGNLMQYKNVDNRFSGSKAPKFDTINSRKITVRVKFTPVVDTKDFYNNKFLRMIKKIIDSNQIKALKGLKKITTSQKRKSEKGTDTKEYGIFSELAEEKKKEKK